MSEEHGILDLSKIDVAPAASASRCAIIPNHVCIVVHLNDVIAGVRGDAVETSWPVAARGTRVRARERVSGERWNAYRRRREVTEPTVSSSVLGAPTLERAHQLRRSVR